MPISIRCIECDGRVPQVLECETCKTAGSIDIETCPRRELTSETLNFIMFYDMAEKGKWPNGQGLLQETAAFFEAWRWFRSEEAQWQEEMAKKPISETDRN